MDRPGFPQGFTPVQTKGFGGFAGPVLEGRDGQGALFLFDIAAQHLNGDDRLHGGMMMSLASIVMGEVARAAAPGGGDAAATRPLSINCDFVSAGEAGERVEGRAIVTRATRSILFITGDLRVGERILMTMTGVYSIKTAQTP
jgi:acyl-coenzyme A thioesterase PaaI-like protein